MSVSQNTEKILKMHFQIDGLVRAVRLWLQDNLLIDFCVLSREGWKHSETASKPAILPAVKASKTNKERHTRCSIFTHTSPICPPSLSTLFSQFSGQGLFWIKISIKFLSTLSDKLFHFDHKVATFLFIFLHRWRKLTDRGRKRENNMIREFGQNMSLRRS